MGDEYDVKFSILILLLLALSTIAYTLYVALDVPMGVQVVKIQFAPGTHIFYMSKCIDGKLVPVSEIPKDFRNYKNIGLYVANVASNGKEFYIYGLQNR